MKRSNWLVWLCPLALIGLATGAAQAFDLKGGGRVEIIMEGLAGHAAMRVAYIGNNFTQECIHFLHG